MKTLSDLKSEMASPFPHNKSEVLKKFSELIKQLPFIYVHCFIDVLW